MPGVFPNDLPPSARLRTGLPVPGNPEEALSLAARCLRSGNYRDGVALASSAALSGKLPRAYAVLAQCLRKAYKIKEARKAYEDGLEKFPSDALLHARFARFESDFSFFRSDRRASMERHVSEALRLAPQNPDVLALVIESFVVTSQFDRAKALLPDYLRVGRNQAFIDATAGAIALGLADSASAGRHFAQVVLRDPKDAYALFQLRKIAARSNPALFPASLRFKTVAVIVAALAYAALEAARFGIFGAWPVSFAAAWAAWWVFAEWKIRRDLRVQLSKMGVQPK